jgi:hypothetical protein
MSLTGIATPNTSGLWETPDDVQPIFCMRHTVEVFVTGEEELTVAKLLSLHRTFFKQLGPGMDVSQLRVSLRHHAEWCDLLHTLQGLPGHTISRGTGFFLVGNMQPVYVECNGGIPFRWKASVSKEIADTFPRPSGGEVNEYPSTYTLVSVAVPWRVK